VRFKPGVIALLLAVTSGLGACRTLAALPATPGATLNRTYAPARTAAVIDVATMDRKLMFGYQGWFACPDDGSPLGGWEHWFRRGDNPSAASLRVDMWPDVSELAPDERCDTPLTLPDGRRAQVYSAYNPKTVDRHFKWMEDYELAGVFLQRFSARLENASVLKFRDAVATNVRTSAEAHQRVFALMYDISGQPHDSIVAALKRDWIHIVDDLRLTDSPRYLRHRGRPVLAIWGFGFVDRSATPEQAAELIDFFKNNPDQRYRVTLVGGVPARWRTLVRDSQADPQWAPVYRSFDVLSPWTVGRFRDNEGIDRFYADEVTADREETRRLGIEYLPVVFPGFSWHNMNPTAPFNRIPRRGGRFYWRQVERALGTGNTMLYGAMFDEVDEGTAMFKTAASRADAPKDVPTITLDVDGESLPSDWYLRLAREAQRQLQ
jgi:hypothetical protein